MHRQDSEFKRWESEFARHGLQWPLKYRPYRGQRQFLERILEPLRPVEVVVLPTGYGKTICQIMYVAYLMLTGRIRHVVLLVPKDNLRTSMIEEWQKYLPPMVPGIKILNAIKDLYSLKRYADTTKNLVVVASYQQAGNSELLHFCRAFDCAVVADEAHHLYEEGVWAKNTAALESDHKMYFTATPVRSDRSPLQDAPNGPDGRPDYLVNVSIKDAQDEKALCTLRAIAVRFWVDVRTEDGVYRVTTDDLESERIDFNSYEARRQLRYEEGFTSPMIENMLVIYNSKHVQEPFKHQILVKAMTTHHADALCKLINTVMQDDDFAYAVHVGKSNEECDRLLCRFRGVRRGDEGQEIEIPDDKRFPCLVQVDMAGEGYNNPYISILVKADLTKSPPYIMQLIGRALRVNYTLDVRPQTIDVLIPDDDRSTMDLIESEFAVEPAPISTSAPRAGGERGILLLDIPDVYVLEAGFIKLYELNGSAPTSEDDDVRAWADSYVPGWRQFCTLAQLRSAYMMAKGAPMQAKSDDAMSESAKREKWRQETERACSFLAGNVIRVLSNQPLYHNGDKAAARVKPAIHARWVINGGMRTKQATADDFEQKHAWIKEVNESVKAGSVPQWLQDAYYDR